METSKAKLVVTNTTSTQEIFTFVVEQLLLQGKRSLSGLITCAYRGEGQSRCAAGMILPDEYSPEMEGRGIRAIPWFRMHLSHEAQDMLAELQEFHDSSSFWEKSGGFSSEGKTRLGKIARTFHIKVPE